jgi:SAM-dependent methyltransferase
MSWDPVWSSVFSNQAWGKYPNDDVIRFVASHYYKIPRRADVRLLEIGCGPGANVWFMAREGFTTYGIDGSDVAIEQAQVRLDREVPGWSGELRVGDIGKLPFADASFDAVLDNEAVCCNPWEASQAIYAEAWRVLKTGGKLFSRTFGVGCWGDGEGERVGRNAWLCADGPLQGKGLCRFTAPEEVAELIGPQFRIDSIECSERTLQERTKRIRELVIIAVKP